MFLLWLLIERLTVGNPQIEYIESLRIWEGMNESPVLFRRVAANVDEGVSQCKLVFAFRLKPRTAAVSVTGVGSSASLILRRLTQWCAHVLMGGQVSWDITPRS